MSAHTPEPLPSSSPQQRIAELENALAAAEQQAAWEAEAARIANEDMQHFIYAVSHDLRQPLRGILTSAQLLDRDPELHAQVSEYTSTIIQGAGEMNALIDRLLTYSRVASSLRRTIVPLDPVVQWALMSLNPLVTESQACITWEGLPVLDIDDSVFSMLLQELIRNSIFYRGAEPPRIVISAESDDSGHTVSVRDNGCGIAPEFHDKVFIPFQRLHKGKIPGFGLGLSICRKIVRAHGGTIWVESDGANGSTFRFTIPN